ncbi:MAG: GtrA family protein [Oscillospiraceae bacterium]|nr:GtrA family protein [Oscillospiraceae bacterium]
MDRLLAGLRIRLSRHLPNGVMRVIRPFLTVQFIVFMLMGIANTAVSVCTATFLDIIHRNFLSPDNILRILTEHSRLNFIIGYMVSIITSFFLNSKFTFHQKPTWKKFVKFPISYIPNFIIQYLMVLLFTTLNLNSTLAYICAAILGTPITFAAMKLMIFKRRQNT